MLSISSSKNANTTWTFLTRLRTAIMEAERVFVYLSGAGPHIYSQIKFEYENRTRQKKANTHKKQRLHSWIRLSIQKFNNVTWHRYTVHSSDRFRWWFMLWIQKFNNFKQHRHGRNSSDRSHDGLRRILNVWTLYARATYQMLFEH